MAGEDAGIIDLYERHALAFDGMRGRNLFEKPWLEHFAGLIPRRGHVLDLGCGGAEPMAAHLIKRGFHLTGVDTSKTLIGLARKRFPGMAWYEADMRTFYMPTKFSGILAWHSFFHLNADDQRAMFPRFGAMAGPGAALMFTSGHFEGEAMGEFGGEPLYHASLSGEEYRALLAKSGFQVVAQISQDPACGGATVWLAKNIRR
jgi:SAM-dependent methyltransferase